ncbi:Uncharacterised protein [uncultured archaeon]|nr:Uncharacterised protein [uncultured archaeon]
MFGLSQYLRDTSEKVKKEKKDHPALSAILVLTISAGLATGVNYLVNKDIETRTKQKFYSETYKKADTDTNKIIDYRESYNLGIKLNVIKETNICPLTSFDEIFNKASVKNITNYLN